MPRKICSSEAISPHLVTPQKIENEMGRVRFIPRDPTRLFKVGEPVSIGALLDARVIQVLNEGLFYVVEYVVPARDREPAYKKQHVFPWLHVFAFPDGRAKLFVPEEFRVRSGSASIKTLMGYYYRSGIDFTPGYQRPFEWRMEDDVRLIETLFERGSIGLIAFNILPFNEHAPHREIVDGKQRLHALSRFIEGRFPVRGYYFHDLAEIERAEFENIMIPIFEIENGTLIYLLKLFLRINRRGVRVSDEHIGEIEKRLADEEAKALQT